MNIVFTSEHFVPSRKGLEKGGLLWATDPHPLHLHPPPTPVSSRDLAGLSLFSTRIAVFFLGLCLNFLGMD